MQTRGVKGDSARPSNWATVNELENEKRTGREMAVSREKEKTVF
jgi:hypothetical protein